MLQTSANITSNMNAHASSTAQRGGGSFQDRKLQEKLVALSVDDRMTSGWNIYLSDHLFDLSICLYSLSAYLSVCLSMYHYVSVYVLIYLILSHLISSHLIASHLISSHLILSI